MIDLAHGVGRTFESPIPTWLYAVGAAATVAASFVIRALVHDVRVVKPERRLAGERSVRVLAVALRVMGVLGLILILTSGLLAGSGGRLAPLLLWAGLIVGIVLLSAVVDGVWSYADPWATLESVYRIEGATPRDREPPWWIGPLLLYALFWFELVSGSGFDASFIVLAIVMYSVFAFVARPVFGKYWNLADPLSILFGFAGRCAPLRLGDDGMFYRGPIRALDRSEPMPLSLYASIFILLASTTLDNVRETVGWTSFRVDTGLDDLPSKVVDSMALPVFAGLFLAPFLGAILVAKRSLRHDMRAARLGRHFGWSLVPIGVAYVVAHNVPLFISGLPQIVRGFSDPFERGWNLFGTAHAFESFSASPRLVWFLEIAVIVGGHILGVLAAHRAAVRLSDTRRGAVMSQLTLTVLMSLFTITTLWLLAQPLVS